MATDFNSFDASPLGAFTESTLGARNGNVRNAFILPAIVERGGRTLFALLLVKLPGLNVTGIIVTPKPIRRPGGWRDTIFYIERGDLVRASLDWDTQRFTIDARRNIDDIARSNVPALPERLVFHSSEWQIVPGSPPANTFELFVGPSKAIGRFVVTLTQFGTYMQVRPTVGDTRQQRIVYRAAGRMAAGGTVDIDGVQQIFGAATNDVAPVFLRPTTSGAAQHIITPLETWFDEDIGYMELDTGAAYVLLLEGGLIVAAYPLLGGLAALRHPRPGWSTWASARVDGDDRYQRGDIAFEPDRNTIFASLVDNQGNLVEESVVWIPDPITRVLPTFVDPIGRATVTIRELLHGMIPG